MPPIPAIVRTALLHVAIVPRFSLAVTTETLKNLGESI